MQVDIPVRGSASLKRRVIRLSTWDQVFPCLYTPRFTCFATPADFDKESTVNHLKDALSKALTEWPEFAGTLVDEDAEQGTCSLALDDSDKILFRLCDYTSGPFEELSWRPWTFEEFTGKGCPPSMLSQAPLANFDRGIATRPCPVTKIQATIIPGGLILAMGFIHRVFDGQGFLRFIRSWARHTASLSRGVRVDMRAPYVSDRTPLVGRYEGGAISELPEWKVADPFTLMPKGTPPKVVCSVWRIGKSEQANLKAKASSYSTNDAICGQLWLSINKAREIQRRGFQSSGFSIGKDLRTILDPRLDNDFTGNVTYRVGPVVEIEEFSTLALPEAAECLRTSLDSVRQDSFRNVLGILENAASFKTLVPNYHVHHGPDVFLTTHANFGEYEMDWGANLGSPEVVRVLTLPVEGFCIILPRRLDGSLEVMVSLDEHYVSKLRNDDQFRHYFSFVCD